MVIEFNLENIEDLQDRENAEKLATEFKSNPFLNGSFKHFILPISMAATGYRFKHNLGYRPYDVWLTHVSNNSAVTIDHETTDEFYITFNFPSACVVRFFAGSVR